VPGVRPTCYNPYGGSSFYATCRLSSCYAACGCFAVRDPGTAHELWVSDKLRVSYELWVSDKLRVSYELWVSDKRRVSYELWVSHKLCANLRAARAAHDLRAASASPDLPGLRWRGGLFFAGCHGTFGAGLSGSGG
jgi:hypothetical protein